MELERYAVGGIPFKTEGRTGLTRSEILDYLREVIPVVVQMVRTEGGRRGISEIKFTKAETI